MRCPTPMCPGGPTRRIRRVLTLNYSPEGEIGHADIRDLWLCNTCGVAFAPGTTRSPRWSLPWGRTRPRKRFLRNPDGTFLRRNDGKRILTIDSHVRGGRIPKSWIVEELFRANG